MTQWSITQWASLCSILIVAISAIALCSRTLYIVGKLEEKVKQIDGDCAKHRNDSDLHRSKDYERWIAGRFDGIEDKLDEIKDSLRLPTQTYRRKQP